MSTQIYNGYRLPMMTLKELTEFTKKFRLIVEKKAGELMSVFIANEVVEIIDDIRFLDEETFVRRHMLYEKEKERLIQQESLIKRGVSIEDSEIINLTIDAYSYRSPYTIVYRKTQERYNEIQRTKYRDPDVDFDCSACFIPLEDKILALFYTEQKELKELWANHSDVTYYGYWNNSDPDEECTQEEWEQRKKDWDEALPGIGVPMLHGICVDFIKGFLGRQNITPELIVKHIPKVYDRAKRIAKASVVNRKYIEMKSELQEDQNMTISEFQQIAKWMSTNEGMKVLKEEIDKVIPLITCKIKKAHLFTGIIKQVKGELDHYEEDVVKHIRNSYSSIRGKARLQNKGRVRKKSKSRKTNNRIHRRI